MTMVKNGKLYIGTVSHGKARILRAPGSDVSLEIPKGSRGVYVMGVHTDVSTYKNCVKDMEWFVSPVVEIEHRRSDNNTTDKLLKPYTPENPSLFERQVSVTSPQSSSWEIIQLFRRDPIYR